MVRIMLATAAAADVAAVAELLDGVDRFYGAAASGSREDRVTRIEQELFGAAPSAQALLAWDGDAPVGLAVCSVLWPAAGVDRSLYLKQLYVAGSHRGSGVGTMLMQAVIDLARELGCRRIEWTTDTDQPEAQRFYERLGVPPLSSKVFHRMPVD